MKHWKEISVVMLLSGFAALGFSYTVDFEDETIGELTSEIIPEGEASYEVSGGILEVTATPVAGGEEDCAGPFFYVDNYVSGNEYNVTISGKFKFVTLPDESGGKATIELMFTDSEWENDYYSTLSYIEALDQYALSIQTYMGPVAGFTELIDFYGEGWFEYEFNVLKNGANDELTVTLRELEDDFDVWTTSGSVTHTDGFTLQEIGFVAEDPDSGSDTSVFQGDNFYFTGSAPSAVPEPSTVILLLLGICGIGARRFRKKK